MQVRAPAPAEPVEGRALSRARGGRWQLVFAGGAVLVAAADTYVVVLVLTAMMADLDISIDQLQQATPVVSGFLVGYVAILPLLGRLSDLCGRRPVFIGCLLAFACGSLVTASGTSLGMVVVGRTLQGLGGGGLVPVTLALVADLWPTDARAKPLGIVAGVQEFGSVLGPLYGAAIISVTSWRAIFWVNLPLSAMLGLGLWLTLPRKADVAPAASVARRRDVVGGLLLLLTAVCAAAAVAAPAAFTDNAVIGAVYLPLAGSSEALAPVSLAALAAALAFCIWETLAPFDVVPLLRLRGAAALLQRADWFGALLLAAVLAMIVIIFSTADPMRQVVSTSAIVLGPLALAAAVCFVIHERRVATPLIDFAVIRDRAAVGAVVANLFVGAGLMAALIDVPIFARTTAFPDSQLGAALVLLRLLAAVPVGAVVGGIACQRLGYRAVAGAAMVLSGLMFVVMARWDGNALTDPLMGLSWLHLSDLTLVACGLGFGLAIAPVNAAMLEAVAASWHGLAASLVVMARSVGMLVGLSVLTAIGLHAFNDVAATLASPQTLCPDSPTNCPAYNAQESAAILRELHVVFGGAAVACVGAAAVAIATLRRHPRDGVEVAANAS